MNDVKSFVLGPLFPWKSVAIGLSVISQAFETAVDLRQLKALSHALPPANLVPALRALPSKSEDGLDSAGVFKASQRYARAKLQFGCVLSCESSVQLLTLKYSLVTSAISFVESLATLHFIDKLWSYSVQLLSNRGMAVTPIRASLSFMIFTSALGMITSLPASYYKTFVLEERFGFNKTTKKTWVLDLVKSTALGAALGLPLAAAGLKIVELAGQNFVWKMMQFLIVLRALCLFDLVR